MSSFAILVVRGDLSVYGASPGTRIRSPYIREADLYVSLKPITAMNRVQLVPYIPATSWVGVMRNLLEKYYDLPANVPRIVRAKRIVAPIHECETEEEKLRCPVCKLLARRDVVAWFDDIEPKGISFRVERKEAEVNFYNEKNELVARIYRKDEVTIPREKVEISETYRGALNIAESPITADVLKKAEWRLEPIPRAVELVSGVFTFGAKFLMSKLSVDDIRPFFIGLSLLEDYYVGRRGTRGYGRVKISNLRFTLRTSAYYEGEGDEIEIPIPDDAKTPKGVLKKWRELREAIEEALRKSAGQ